MNDDNFDPNIEINIDDQDADLILGPFDPRSIWGLSNIIRGLVILAIAAGIAYALGFYSVF